MSEIGDLNPGKDQDVKVVNQPMEVRFTKAYFRNCAKFGVLWAMKKVREV